AMASRAPQARRTLAVRGLLVLGGVLLLASLLFGWANRSFFDRDGFTTRSMAALDQPAVQGRLAEVVSHSVVEWRPRLENAQPLIAAAIAWLISTMPFRDALEEAPSFLHNQLFEDDPDRLALRIRGIIERLRQVLEVVAPDLAAELPSADSIDAPIAEGDDLRAELVDVAEAVGFLAFVLPLLALGA